VLFRKKNKTEKDVKSKKQENNLITKESISAVCCLFSTLALLILCTDTLVFGELGRIIADFLLGVFGYSAYPIFLGTAYLSITAFIEKRFVKNRVAFTLIAVGFFSLLALIQTAVTYSWANEQYPQNCFLAGENYTTATLLGWVGGLFIVLLNTFLSKIGTIVVLGLLSILCVYFGSCSLTGKRAFALNKARTPKPKRVKEKKLTFTQEQAQPVFEDNQQQNAGGEFAYPNYPVMQREGFSESAYSYVSQRPSFSINGNTSEGNSIPTRNEVGQGAYSPFGNFGQNKTTGQELPIEEKSPASPEEYRNFLFNGTSAEDFRKNLMNVNKRYSESSATVNQEPSGNSGFNSYTKSYENDLNNGVRPQKIVQDTTPTIRDYSPQTPAYEQPRTYDEPFTRNVSQPVSRRDEPFVRENTDRKDSLGFDRGTSILNDPVRQQPSVSFSRDNVEREIEVSREDTLRRGFGDTFSTPTDRYSISEENSIVEEPKIELPKREEFLNTQDTYLSERTEDFKPIRDRSDRLNIFDDDYLPKDEEEIDEELPKTTSERVIGFGSEIRDRNLDSVRFEQRPIDPPKEITPAPVEPPKPPKPRIYRPYSPAPLHYFNCSDVEPDADADEVEATKLEILKVYEDFGVTGVSIASVTFGPTITRYNIVAPRNISPSKLVSKDVETSMAMSLRVESGVNIYPNFKDGVISIEVPNKKRQTVHLGCMLTGPDYINAKPTSLVFSMGKNVANQKIYGDICKMTHLLVAGSSGSGKSVFLGTLIVSLINHYSPQQLRLILIDPKKTEFVIYRDLPHLMINEIINDPKKAVQSLGWAIGEMNRRYELFEKMSLSGNHVVNIDEYNAKLKDGEEKLPKIVIVVDELADLMLAAKKDVEERIQNLTQKSRAAGIHLIIATQRPSTDVITGVIKSNLATRIAFMVASDVDSRVILDASGAQKLLGYGDMMYIMAGQKEPIRLQSAFISSDDTQRVVEHIKSHNDAYFDEDATNFINTRGGELNVADDDSPEAVETIFIEALKVAILSQAVSISMLQRKCGVGFNKAGKIVDWMEAKGYISHFEGATKPRKVLITKEQFEETYGPF